MVNPTVIDYQNIVEALSLAVKYGFIEMKDAKRVLIILFEDLIK